MIEFVIQIAIWNFELLRKMEYTKPKTPTYLVPLTECFCQKALLAMHSHTTSN